MKNFVRVFINIAPGLVLLFCVGCSLLGGAFEFEPEDMDKNISSGARELIDKAFEGIDVAKLRDYHTHILGMNPDVNGTFVNEDWQTPFGGLFTFFQFEVYKSASGITDEENADHQFLDRLIRLIKHMPKRGKFGIMAFDYFHNENGAPDKSLTTFRVPNDYVLDIVKENPDLFFPIISIHPYRHKAVEELRRHAENGVRFVKWLPNSMGMDPASEKMKEKLEAYYRLMKEFDMALISHTGDEMATEAEEYQHLGNPLYLKKPLSMGVKVVMAHVASLGVCKEIEKHLCEPGKPYIDLAIQLMKDQLMKEEKYKNLLFADISALTQDNRKDNLDRVLEETSIHSNLINGSDYPLPAINIVIRTQTLVGSNNITPEERVYLNEIYNYNPLLFDFVLKRTIRHSKTGKKFPDSVFLENQHLPTN